ncbi:Fe-S cluster assembly sulfur transfer protein SufU [Acetobacter sp.]|uniref:Fe-S cluster assembly sulfur transfer protein SufU n=1 Tax=Acetobacter sp. TaxID=440 RepID=UPI0039E7FA06
MTQVLDGSALYDQLIVARSRAPLFAGRLEQAEKVGNGKNPLCGDKTRVELALDHNHISQVRHQTRGCAICLAAADLMAERILGLSPAQALQVGQRFSALLVEDTAPATVEGEFEEIAALGPLKAFAPLRAHRSRIRCAELPWVALKEALSHDDV